MELLLIRHGEATPVGHNGVMTDEERDLTECGAERVHRAGSALGKLDIRVNAILSSPYPRAVSTARIIGEHLERKPRLRTSEQLIPGAPLKGILELLAANAELRTLAVCSHEPNLSRLSDKLLGSRRRASLVFHTGSIAYMHVDLTPKTPAATLHWFLDSRQLDMIAQAP